MPPFICTTCGTQHAETPFPPERCAICEDERQYIGWGGQQWTTLDRLQADHTNQIREEEPNLTGVGTTPKFGIGQWALLIRSPGGNVLWDCISLLDEATIEAVRQLGGLAAIAISHPHYYSSMVEWSRAFGDVPIYLHAADRDSIMRTDPAIEFWEGETRSLHDGLTLIRCGGHFDGGRSCIGPQAPRAGACS
jgi:glyoxylase-like metal-dependent hydrolase (beta-lactamase superfamily II)